ncbi:glycosyl transferase, family 2 [Nitrobacter sp. Nb-311A]|uniref:glycosyltransferase family 92 protein n=1 Tax=unclassified Nitrobacter TaxID=2620411 RepID=UPI0000686406|nr:MULTISPECIES: glycosyltransferase family 92 protein [unclassified Nitrobacter]EAQ37388.1 glycosyl transferase, family 2 [Nitrobacter sp. Nb-311A]MCB1392523.1 glycosyltransferase family 92 protein [Nitrobacter sp.]MCV0385277.1 glycosyltransferase family 92 protein [Nitrobacter sp.]
METETATLTRLGLDLDVGALTANEIEPRLKEFFSGRIANPNPEELMHSVKELEEQFSGYREYQFARAAVLMQACDFARARDILARLARELPSDSRILHRLAVTHLNMGSAEAAQDTYLAALAIASSSENLRREFAGLLRVMETRKLHAGVNRKKHRLSVVCAIKNEADDLLEWLHLHKLVGVDHFYLYDNESTDETRAIIESFPWPDMITYHYVKGEFGQIRAFHHAIDSYRNNSEWCAFIDADEFLYPVGGNSIRDVLDDVPEAPAVAVQWLNFGSNGHDARPQGLCIESFTRRAPDDFPDHYVMKSIVRPDAIVAYLHPHQSLVLGCYVQEDGTPVFPIGGRCAVPKRKKLAINHYYTKSRQQLLKKRERGRPLAAGDPERIRAMEFFTLRDRNDVEDPTILKFLPELKKQVYR